MVVDQAELEEFVRQSNRIEGEPDEPGHPLFDDHLSIATSLAATAGWAWTPVQIHRVLMRSQPHKFPGELRQVRVAVGGREKMPPVEVRPAYALLSFTAAHGPKDEDQEGWCWTMHHWLESIHPFVDGNGRTGRLWLNALRLAHGLPWLTVRYEERFAYYRSIEEWEHEAEALVHYATS